MRFDPVVVRNRLENDYTVEVTGEAFVIKVRPGKNGGFTFMADFAHMGDMDEFVKTMTQWGLKAKKIAPVLIAKNRVSVRTMDPGVATAILGELAYQSESGWIYYAPRKKEKHGNR